MSAEILVLLQSVGLLKGGTREKVPADPEIQEVARIFLGLSIFILVVLIVALGTTNA